MAVKYATLIMAGALLAGVAGCGQKGPLYLPDKGGAVVTRPGGQAQQPAPQLPQSPATAPQAATPPAQAQPNGADTEKKNQAPK